MRFVNVASRRRVLAQGIALATCAASGVTSGSLAASEAAKAKSAGGTFVSFKDGTLTVKGNSGLIVYEQVGANYRTFENNEDGPGSKPVDTVDSLSRAVPGTVVQVQVEDREISLGLDHRVIGTLVSYQDGELKLLVADAPPGFVQRQTGEIALTIDPNTPVLESIAGADLKFAGAAGEILKAVRPGTLVTARSEYDANGVEVVELGKPRRRMERYVGQTRGPVRGTFESFQEGVLRIRGKGLTSSAANEYERTIAWRIGDDVPVFESIDGGEYQPAGTAAVLKTVKEGTIITIRKIQDVLIDVRIGVTKQN